MSSLSIVLVLVAAVVVLLFFLKDKLFRREEEPLWKTWLQEKDNELKGLKESLAEREGKLELAQREKESLEKELVSLKVRSKSERKFLEEKLSAINETKEQLSLIFEKLSSEALRTNNQSFLELAEQSFKKLVTASKGDFQKCESSIGQLVQPIVESLNKVDEKVKKLEEARIGAYASLSEQVKGLMESQALLQREAASLVQALGSPNIRGQWGEIQLKRVVEYAGMVEHCDFEQQLSVSTSEGGLRPDMVVRLPNDRIIVVDAKVPLSEYLASFKIESASAKKEALKRHARQIKDHLSKLSTRQYWKQFSESPEFVVLFLPGESILSAALEGDSSLIEFGIKEKVIVATPTTLIALLKAVAYGWQQQKMTQEAKQIVELGQQLYDRMSVFSEHFNKIGRSLDNSVEAYNQAVRSTESRLLPTVRKFKDLSLNQDKSIRSLDQIESTPRKPQVEELLLK